MKMRLVVGTAVALITAGSSAYAADLGMPFRPPPPMPMAPAQYSWSGCYGGMNAGLGAGHTQWSDPQPDGNIDGNAGLARTANTDMTGGLLGAQIGCDMQFGGNWVTGIAASFDASDMAGANMDQFNVDWSLRDSLQWVGTVTGRFGYAANNVLVYAKGGVAFAQNEYEIVNASAILGEPTPVQTGYTVGTGIEWAFSPCWSVFAEANYYGFGSQSETFNLVPIAIAAPGTVNVKPSFETATLGINYRFGNN
jgi:outer membrane immunogenic protein